MAYKIYQGQKHIAVMGIKGLPSKGGGERVAEAIIRKALDKNFKITVYGKKSYCADQNCFKNLNLILIKDLKGKTLTVYESGKFIDLCSGPHVKSVKEIPFDGFKLTK